MKTEDLIQALHQARANPEELYGHTYFPLLSRDLLDKVIAALTQEGRG